MSTDIRQAHVSIRIAVVALAFSVAGLVAAAVVGFGG